MIVIDVDIETFSWLAVKFILYNSSVAN